MYLEEKVFVAVHDALRKTPERVFGIMKRRSTILKHSIELHKAKEVGDVFRVSAIVHNMMLHHYGRLQAGQRPEDFRVRKVHIPPGVPRAPALRDGASALRRAQYAYAAYVTYLLERGDLRRLKRLSGDEVEAAEDGDGV